MTTLTQDRYAAGVATTTSQDIASLVGRALLAALFIPTGFGKIGGFAGTAGYIASQGIPLPEVAAAIAIAAELGLGLLLLVGFKARWAALGLAVFTAVITPLFHGYWALPEAQQMVQKLMFWKNYAIVGGLLMVFAFGPGRFSFDARRA
jgi:putative oxidoreductase